MNKSKPIVSIVTIVYNDIGSIERTILSVLEQTYQHIEYIIIDGGSKDGTVDIIKKYDQYIYYWVSEPDNGIYDAMNKGIDKAAGDWIIFINSGDQICENSLSEIFSINHTSDVIYGDCINHFEWVNIIYAPKELEYITTDMPFNHPATITKTAIAKKTKFDCKYKIAADYDFFYKLYNQGYKFEYFPISVSTFDMTDNGVSKTNIELLKKEVEKISGKSQITLPPASRYKLRNKFVSTIKKKMKLFIPKQILKAYRKKVIQRILKEDSRMKDAFLIE